MQSYIDIVRKVLKDGKIKENRTGVNTLAISGAMFEHDMADGFPLLTTKKIPFRLVASELEFFIKGLTDKQWLQDRDNHIWDAWCNPLKVPYGNDTETKAKMKAEMDLGPIYGFQWRNFNGWHVDQLANLIETIKTNPNDRRMLVTAWNPIDLDFMALPPCHYCFQVTIIDGKLNLLWNQRSVDVALGLPFDIASYGLLLHLLAKETGYAEGKLTGFLADTHIYVNHLDGLKEQLTRPTSVLPEIITDYDIPHERFSILDWEYTDTKLINYKPKPAIKFEVAI
jgi:thymidylate synthase